VTFGLMLAGFLGATNAGRVALGLGAGRADRRTLGVVLAAGAALILAGVLLADPLLDALDITPESFRIAAGIVLAAMGAATLVRPRPGGPAGALLVTPELACMAIAASADQGIGPALGAAVIALAVVAALALLPRVAPAGRAAPFLAALAVVAGVALIVAGVRDV
jgi:small neutral amino acid transporter SnatA (MarC family)